MSTLALVLIGDSGADAGPRVPVRYADRVQVVSVDRDDPASVAGAITGTSAPFVCLASREVRLLEDGLGRTLEAIAEPALPSAADGWIHRSMFVLCEGTPPDAREVHRLTLGQDSLAATPAAVLGGAMAQPGSLVVTRAALLDILARLAQSGDGGPTRGVGQIVADATRALGTQGRLMLLPWVLSERLALRSPEEIDLGDALGVDIAMHSAAAEIWRASWLGAEELSMAQLRVVHALAEPPRRRSLVHRAVSRVRRMLR